MLRRGGPRAGISSTLALASLVGAGCGPSDGLSPRAAPTIFTAAVAANAHNVLSLVVTAEVENADSVLVQYGRVGEPLDSSAAAVRPDAGSVSVPVLGLLPETSYELRLVAHGSRGAAERDLGAFVTGSLPADLPAYSASGSDPSPGYVVFAAGRYGLAIDNGGRVVWYHAFPSGPGLNFQPQPNGRYAARPLPPDPATLARWVEIDPLGNETRTFGCARGLQPRFHDMIANPDGDYWLMCDETRAMDLSAFGGSEQAEVTGTVVQHLSAGGGLLFEWSAFDHFAITDLEPAARTGTEVNWTHGNALDLDADGSLLVSFRSLNEVTKIDVMTGSVLWRMGGLRNGFTFLDSPTPAFARQHGVRVTGAGQLTLLDNSGDAAATRAERYTYDAGAGTARLVASYGPADAVTARLGGTTQALPGGRTLVAFGDGRRVQEYDAAGDVVWEIGGDPGYVFRAERIGSLYHLGVDSTW